MQFSENPSNIQIFKSVPGCQHPDLDVEKSQHPDPQSGGFFDYFGNKT